MNVDKIKHHINHLKEKHSIIDNKIKDSYNHHEPDEILKKLKIEKLTLKQEIDSLEHKIATRAV